jgi:hypothetical protein
MWYTKKKTNENLIKIKRNKNETKQKSILNIEFFN